MCSDIPILFYDWIFLLAQFASVIKQLLLNVFLLQNLNPGSLVYDINATYEGKSIEENYKYSIIYGSSGKFEIHFETGKITTLKPLDREDEARYTVHFGMSIIFLNFLYFAVHALVIIMTSFLVLLS